MRADNFNELFSTEPLSPLTVKPISFQEAKDFVTNNHYAGGMHNGPSGKFGLFDGKQLVGACVFATPISENVRASIFGDYYKSTVTELHRLVILDEIPRNAESYFISRALWQLKAEKPHLWGVVSFADTTFGHVGTIYQASNGLFYGLSSPEKTYREIATGRLRHKRQCGRNIPLEEAISRGWEVVDGGPKCRYLFKLPNDRRHARLLNDLCQVKEIRPNPKARDFGITNNKLIKPV